jgi:hypothetical protein
MVLEYINTIQDRNIKANGKKISITVKENIPNKMEAITKVIL